MEGRKLVTIFAEMSCEGCSGAITRILSKIPGLSDITCSIQDQRVTFSADPSFNSEIAISKLQVWAEASGKQVSLIS
jgi:copper chaperone